MSLTGTFEASDFGEVLSLLSRRGSTGRLQVRAGSRHALIRLVDGLAVGVEGMTTSWSEGESGLRSSLEDVCFEVLRAGRGTFEFQADQGVAERPPGRTVRLATVVAAAEQRLAEWREVEAVIPSLDSVPRLAESLRSDELVVNQEQWRVVVSIDGRRSVGGIARKLGRRPSEVCQLLKPLVEDGAVSLARNEPLARRELPRVERLAIADTAEDPEATPATEGETVEATRRRPRISSFRVLARPSQ